MGDVTVTPTPPRYESRKNPDSAPERPWQVFDTFTQSFVDGEAHPTWSQALSATARHNRAYREAVS